MLIPSAIAMNPTNMKQAATIIVKLSSHGSRVKDFTMVYKPMVNTAEDRTCLRPYLMEYTHTPTPVNMTAKPSISSKQNSL